MTKGSRILVIEDHAGIAESLRANLEVEGHLVSVAPDGSTGIGRSLSWAPDLVILDLMLPGVDGFEVLETLRARRSDVPVLILSALGAEAVKVRGFRSGADDYLTKPFGLLELLARVEALLRRGARTAAPAEAPVHRFGDVTVTLASRTVTRHGVPVALRAKEFDLLVALAGRPGQVISKQRLLREVWGYDAAVVSRTVDTHVLELRRKLEADPALPRHIRTVRGSGYLLDP